MSDFTRLQHEPDIQIKGCWQEAFCREFKDDWLVGCGLVWGFFTAPCCKMNLECLCVVGSFGEQSCASASFIQQNVQGKIQSLLCIFVVLQWNEPDEAKMPRVGRAL